MVAWARRASPVATRIRRAVPFAAGIVAAFVGIWLYMLVSPGPAPLNKNDVKTGVNEVLASMTPAPPYSQTVYAVARPSVVVIESAQSRSESQPPTASPAPGASQPQGASPSPGSPEEAIGTGVVVDDRGDILTSLHVVAGSPVVNVTFADGTMSPAEIIASQPEKDIAVLRPITPPAQVVPAVLGNPNAVQIGDEAFVVGNPFGLTGSMSSGVISGLGRSFEPQGGGQALHGLIQIDAAVNPGNSGGPLLNRDGQVIGIVAALFNPTDERVFVGIGFAVPIDVAGGAAGLPPY